MLAIEDRPIVIQLKSVVRVARRLETLVEQLIFLIFKLVEPVNQGLAKPFENAHAVVRNQVSRVQPQQRQARRHAEKVLEPIPLRLQSPLVPESAELPAAAPFSAV